MIVRPLKCPHWLPVRFIAISADPTGGDSLTIDAGTTFSWPCVYVATTNVVLMGPSQCYGCPLQQVPVVPQNVGDPEVMRTWPPLHRYEQQVCHQQALQQQQQFI